MQNTAAWIVTRTSRYSHITPVLKHLHWLPVNYRVQFKISVHTYEALHGQAPGYITDMLNVYQPRRTVRSMDSVTLEVPRARTVTYGDRKSQFSAAKLWNALPAHIREAQTLNTLKKLLKTHLFLAHFWCLTLSSQFFFFYNILKTVYTYSSYYIKYSIIFHFSIMLSFLCFVFTLYDYYIHCVQRF